MRALAGRYVRFGRPLAPLVEPRGNSNNGSKGKTLWKKWMWWLGHGWSSLPWGFSKREWCRALEGIFTLGGLCGSGDSSDDCMDSRPFLCASRMLRSSVRCRSFGLTSRLRSGVRCRSVGAGAGSVIERKMSVHWAGIDTVFGNGKSVV